MAAAVKFEAFSEHLAEKVHDLNADSLKVYLTNATPNAAAHAVKADLAEISAGNGYTAGGEDVHNATLRRDARLPADPGAVTITPKAAGLLRHMRILAEPGSLAIGAAAARLLRHRAMLAEPGALAIAAQPATLRATRRLLAEGTALALMARDADLRAAKPTATPRGPHTPAVPRGPHTPAVARG